MNHGILEAIADPSRAAERLGALVDEYRRGRDIHLLLPAMESEDEEIVSLAAWIVSEIPTDRYRDTEIVPRLRRLVRHRDAAVRCHAFVAIFPVLRAEEPDTRSLVDGLLQDPSAAVRTAARAADSQLFGRRN